MTHTRKAQPDLSATGRPTRVRYGVLAALCAAASIAYIGRNCISIAEEPIAKELELDTRAMGLVMSAFFWSYALAQIPTGWLGHIWGPRKALPLYAAAWSVACACLGFATGTWTLIAAQLAFGTAQAGIFPCSGAILGVWLPTRRRGLGSGLVGGFQSFGGVLAAPLTALLLGGAFVVGVTWRQVYFLYAVPGIVWALFFVLWFRNRPEQHRRVNNGELAVIRGGELGAKPQVEDRPPPVPWGRILGSFTTWMIFGQQFFRAVGYIFFATWFPKFLQETHGASLSEAGVYTALPLTAVVVGCPIGGWLVDAIYQRTGSLRLSRQGVAAVAMLACAVFIGAAFFVSELKLAVWLIAGGSFFAAMGGPCGYTIIIDKGGRHVAPLFGAVNMCGNLGAAICPIVVAEIAVRFEWSVVLVFFAAVYVGAAVCWLLINPNPGR